MAAAPSRRMSLRPSAPAISPLPTWSAGTLEASGAVIAYASIGHRAPGVSGGGADHALDQPVHGFEPQVVGRVAGSGFDDGLAVIGLHRAGIDAEILLLEARRG